MREAAVAPTGEIQAEDTQTRTNQRLLSHTIIDVRPFRYLPLFTQSSHLLDISSGGVLLEFITTPRITAGKKYWMIGHLTPLGIGDVRRLECYLECRWVNADKCRVGGSFVGLDAKEQHVIAQVLQHIRDKS